MKQLSILILIALLFVGCRQRIVDIAPDDKTYAEFVVEENLLTCFGEGITDEDDKPYNCEASAVASYSEVMIFGNDKNSREQSTVFTGEKKRLLAGEMDNPFPLKQDIFFAMHKIEDMASTIDDKYLFVTSGFDRIKEGSSQWDTYNMLLAWDVLGNKFQIIAESENHGIKSSKELRSKFLKLLDVGHMKIEGLMILPGNRLVFGVREVGPNWQATEYVCTFIQCTYKMRDGNFTLNDDMHISYKFDSSVAHEGLGLSSMTYDRSSQNIYITTSLEEGPEGDKMLGAYMWELPLADYNAKKAPKLIHLKDGKPLFMRHKAEGIAKFDDNTFFIIHDNDRTDIPVELPNGSTVSRKKNEAVYSIVKLTE